MHDSVAQLYQPVSKFTKLGINLVSIAQRDNILTGCLYFNAVKLLHCEFSWPFDLVDSRRRDLIIFRNRRDGRAASRSDFLFHGSLFYPALANQVC